MAQKLFADRAFITINGFETAHVKTSNLKSSESLSRVSTMTRNRRDPGYKRGNKSIQISLTLEIEQQKAQIDLAIADPTADVQLVYECGAERYNALGLAQSEMTLDGSVGDANKQITLEALDLVNENGTSVNADISL